MKIFLLSLFFILSSKNVLASTIVDANTGEIYEDLEEALSSNVIVVESDEALSEEILDDEDDKNYDDNELDIKNNQNNDVVSGIITSSGSIIADETDNVKEEIKEEYIEKGEGRGLFRLLISIVVGIAVFLSLKWVKK